MANGESAGQDKRLMALDAAAELLFLAAGGRGRGEQHTCSLISWCIFQHLGGDPGAYLWGTAS